jgi:hypothetical protein
MDAGRLPEVGSTFTYKNETLTCHFIDGDGDIWAHDIDNKIVTPLLRDCQPIETPEEKAQRERDEWIDNACSFICFYDIGRVDAIKSLEITYDKLKSGELSMPGKE